MQERKFKIVKLTPIALASCERCNTTFHSYQRIEDEAEREMKALFDRHSCGAAGKPGENN
jgi:NMD protein affecting ribosome stability and mRNA decay